MEEVFSVFDSFSGSISFTVYTRMLPNVLLVWRRLWSVMFSACNLEIISFFGAYLQKTNILVTFKKKKIGPYRKHLFHGLNKNDVQCMLVWRRFRSVMFSACTLGILFVCWHLFAEKKIDSS
jgi:hypothetical protein